MDILWSLYWIGCIITILLILYKLVSKSEEFEDKYRNWVNYFNPILISFLVIVIMICTSFMSWLYIFHIIKNKKDD
jgi:uncharacterized membrane protein